MKQVSIQFLLDKEGLTLDNSLVWSSNFGLSSASEVSDSGNFRSLCSDLDDLTKRLLAGSSAQVIIVCGEFTQRLIEDDSERLEISGPYQMIISHQEISVSFHADKQQLRRIYIYAPELLDVLYGDGWVRRRRMSLCLKLAAIRGSSDTPSFCLSRRFYLFFCAWKEIDSVRA